MSQLSYNDAAVRWVDLLMKLYPSLQHTSLFRSALLIDSMLLLRLRIAFAKWESEFPPALMYMS